MKPSSSIRNALLASVAALLFSPVCVQAGVDPWEYEVYQPRTLGHGVLELESTNSLVAHGHAEGGEGVSSGAIPSDKTWYSALELTYGLTDRIEAAVYQRMARPDGGALQPAGNNLRFRGQLFEEDKLPVNLGWYVELEWHKTPQFDDAGRELELRPIIEKKFGRVQVLLNPRFEKVLSGPGTNGGFEFAYAASVRYRARRHLSTGLEFYGATGPVRHADPWSEQQHYVFPTIWGELPGGLEYNMGVGFGLNRVADRMIFKINLELEKYVGALLR